MTKNNNNKDKSEFNRYPFKTIQEQMNFTSSFKGNDLIKKMQVPLKLNHFNTNSINSFSKLMKENEKQPSFTRNMNIIANSISDILTSKKYTNLFINVNKQIVNTYNKQNDLFKKTFANLNNLNSKIETDDFTLRISKNIERIDEIFRPIRKKQIRYNFAQENQFILLDSFPVESNTNPSDYIDFLNQNRKEIFKQISSANDPYAEELSKLDKNFNYKIVLPFLYSYIEYLFRSLFSGINISVSFFNKKNILKEGSKNKKIEVINKKLDEIDANTFLLIVDVSTFLYPNFSTDINKTYRNSIDHGISSPDQWTEYSYLNVLVAILRLENAISLKNDINAIES